MNHHHLELSYKEYLSNKQEIYNSLLDKYLIYEKINNDKGAFGKVYRAMNLQTKKIVAVKLMDKVALENDPAASEKVKEIRRRLLKTESELMMEIQSSHVMKLYDVYENDELKIMVIEYCNQGTLSDYIYHNKQRIPEKQAIEILKQLIRGVAVMHDHCIVHRDLKSDNIMCHNGVYKLIDLGFAKKLPNNYQAFIGTILGTKVTMAPEIIRKEKYGVKADIWSLGIIFYEMIYGQLPYQPLKSPYMYEQILEKDIYHHKLTAQISPSILKLMKKMLQIDQKKRISWQQLISLPIFRQSELYDEVSISVDVHDLTNNSHKMEDTCDDDEHVLIQASKSKSQSMKSSVQLKKISMKERDQLLKKLDQSQQLIVQQAKKYYLQCLKTQFILKNIIIPIEQTKMFSLSSRKMAELLYLLSSRCFLNMSMAQFNLHRENCELIDLLIKSVKILYDPVKEKFEYYSKYLQKIQDKKLEIISDRFRKIIKGEQMKRKDNFLVGVESEKADYTKEQQIHFTYQEYIVPLLTSKEKSPMLINRLEKYQKINFITEQDLKNTKFSELVRQILVNDL